MMQACTLFNAHASVIHRAFILASLPIPIVSSPSLLPVPSLADDFKPLSVDNSKPGKLRVGEGDEVNMSLPVVQVSYTYSTLVLGSIKTLAFR